MEIWPAQHYSPIHSHGGTTGIIYCLAGQIDVMAYKELEWDAEKLGLLTLAPGQCLSQRSVYLNENEMVPDGYVPARPGTREVFSFVDEKPPHEVKDFTTYSDLSWNVLRRILADYAAPGSPVLATRPSGSSYTA